ncbi:hypothetical protein L596_016335 [Steinernema carpocapsae]|uniref:Uncharacterized protein n=1 Tax=Steinernema carpocapsae TaxID=34508 RepID=A0A4U5NIA8_STECR|nr:hypothetical protein L596_016335 [Steinernema carpocapsae]
MWPLKRSRNFPCDLGSVQDAENRGELGTERGKKEPWKHEAASNKDGKRMTKNSMFQLETSRNGEAIICARGSGNVIKVHDSKTGGLLDKNEETRLWISRRFRRTDTLALVQLSLNTSKIRKTRRRPSGMILESESARLRCDARGNMA